MKSNPKNTHEASLKAISDICTRFNDLAVTAAQTYYFTLALDRQLENTLLASAGDFSIDDQGVVSVLASEAKRGAHDVRKMLDGLSETLLKYRNTLREVA